MAQARLAKTQSRLGKTGMLALFVGAVTTLVTAIATLGTLTTAVKGIGFSALVWLNIPDCLTYADIYRGTQSDFKKEGAVWREYAPNAASYNFEFTELRRTREEIILRNITPRPGIADAASLVVRLPVCGGNVILISGLPEQRITLEQIWRDPKG